MTHADLVNSMLLSLHQNGCIAFQANCGMAWTGIKQFTGGALIIQNPRPFRGLPEGFLDIFGYDAKNVPFFMDAKVGKDKLRDKQKSFISAMTARGMRAFEFRSVEEGLQKLGITRIEK